MGVGAGGDLLHLSVRAAASEVRLHIRPRQTNDTIAEPQIRYLTAFHDQTPCGAPADSQPVRHLLEGYVFASEARRLAGLPPRLLRVLAANVFCHLALLSRVANCVGRLLRLPLFFGPSGKRRTSHHSFGFSPSGFCNPMAPEVSYRVRRRKISVVSELEKRPSAVCFSLEKRYRREVEMPDE